MGKKGKSKISKVKRNNQTNNKMSKQGTKKTQRHKAKQPQKQRPPQPQAPPSSDESENDLMDMVDEEDLEYLRKTSSSLLSSVPTEDTSLPVKQLKPRRKRRHSGSDSGLEEEYEENLGEERSANKKMKPLLPIKTKEGIVTREAETDASSSEEEEEPRVVEEEEQEDSRSDSDAETEENKDMFVDQEILSTADLMVARKEELRQKKYKIGTLASGLLECPEKKLRNFYPLLALMDDKNKDDSLNLISVRKLATVSVCEIFKDILPEYQFKHQDYANVKLKKDTLALYKYEKELLEMYKRYLQRLERAAGALRRKRGDHRKSDAAETELALISLQCMCNMLSARPYFNYATNISQTVIPFLNSRDAEARRTVADCVAAVFADDRKGEISLTLVRRINHLVKSRSHNVHPDALRPLLALRIKDVDLDREKQLEVKQKAEEQKKKRIINLSKKERKRNKKLREVEQELMETKAEESRLVKQKNLTEITKTSFMIYFRILKTAPQSALLTATLQGLSKFAHVINIDYYSDLVAILGGLLSQQIGRRERLHCVQTVLAILSGQGDALNVEPAGLYAHLYRGMMEVDVGASCPDAPAVLSSLESLLVGRRRKLSLQVLLAYAKRLGTLALQLPHNGALACLALVGNVLQHSKQAGNLLSLDETVGSGRYEPQCADPEYCNANASALFELASLRRHYHPSVRAAAGRLARGEPLGQELTKLSPQQLFKQYDGSQMAFKPSIPARPNK